ncbi:LYR motif-containing protein 4B-like [Halichondria panicea]|uniref:LYR motif-containing protein 4B-like n=1 Tax=Halichondria panicea TaxID=6063 RepID=UPI00312BB89C
MNSVAPRQVLTLYRKLLRQSSQFSSFNYRKYALRRVKDYFRETRSFTDSVAIEREYSYGLESLNMLKRQTAIGNMYSAPKLVLEKLS